MWLFAKSITHKAKKVKKEKKPHEHRGRTIHKLTKNQRWAGNTLINLKESEKGNHQRVIGEIGNRMVTRHKVKPIRLMTHGK